MAFDYDVLVIGSGFGGSVSALRLAEKGYRVGELDAGRRYTRESFPKTNWDAKNFLWMPALGMRGFQRMTLLKDVLVLRVGRVTGVYSRPDRDWRFHAVNVCVLAEVEPEFRGARNALEIREVALFAPDALPGPLSMGHDDLLADALRGGDARLE